MAKNVQVLRKLEAPKEAGVYHRLICLTGDNKGESYVLLGNRVVIGRSEKSDIRINDAKASREHAEITRVGNRWIATDLGSQNGIIINDKKMTQHQLVEGDKLIIGQSVFKFAKGEVASKINTTENEPSGPLNKGLIPLIILLMVFCAVFVLDDSPNDTKKRKGKKVANFQDVNNEYVVAIQKRQAKENKQLKEKTNVIYQRGLRELREGNYYRAIHEFNLALIIAPGDSQAEYYLRKTKEELDKEIDAYIASAQRDEESLKYKSSIISYCAIVRLLYSATDDPRHKNAEKQIRDLEAKLGKETGETDCLKKQRTSQ